MSREISYNLPGYGFANCFLFGRTVELFDLMDKNNIIQKTKNTSQLGTLKYVYPGAHHTRYEYIFTQWMLISNIVASKGSVSRGVELSLSSYLKEYEVRGWKISGGDVMQSLALLSNVGHMYDTFTMSRILMRLLLESQKGDKVFYTVYKRNLPSTIHNVFDELLEKGNYYKLHLFHAIHIVQGGFQIFVMLGDIAHKLFFFCCSLTASRVGTNVAIPQFFKNRSHNYPPSA